jgi:hypothetical protein
LAKASLETGSSETEKVWIGERVKKLPLEIQNVEGRKLIRLKNSIDIQDLSFLRQIDWKNWFWLGLKDDFDIEEELISK